MNTVRAWLQAARPLAQLNLLLPLVAGQATAWAATGRFSWTLALWVHAFGVFDQLYIIFANDLADEIADRDNDSPTPFSGGSRVLVEGQLSRKQLERGRSVAIALLLGWGLLLSASDRPLGLGFVGAALLLLWAYSYPPLRLSYRGNGELLQGIGVGIVLPTLGYYVQAGTLSGFPTWLLIGGALLGCAGNVTTALPDTEADRNSGKRTVSVRFSEGSASLAMAFATALAAAIGYVMILPRSGWSVACFILFPPLCIPVFLLAHARRNVYLFRVLRVFAAATAQASVWLGYTIGVITSGL
jgi:1,4-dihydroxy-2-naphthoate octaprenyltransferase